MAHTKTFKLGELSRGGVITVEITGKLIVVIGKEWDISKGFKRNSDQSNAKEFTRGSCMSYEDNARYKLFEYLSDLTTSGYADKIIDWIKTKVKLGNEMNW